MRSDFRGLQPANSKRVRSYSKHIADPPAGRQGHRGVAEWTRRPRRMRRNRLEEIKRVGSYSIKYCRDHRGVAEWSNAAVLKTVVPRGTGGSNPSASAHGKVNFPNSP